LSKRIKVGDTAPDFTLKSQMGETVNLGQILKKKCVVLFFYPHDFANLCTRQVCSFRDNYEAFRELGAEVLGISSDTATTHQTFAEKYRLPFSILSDTNDAVRKLYGVVSSLGFLIAGRVTYVIDRRGVVRNIFSSQLRLKSHIEESLEILKSLQ
jgi:peroxiredoxin Q/BCP